MGAPQRREPLAYQGSRDNRLGTKEESKRSAIGASFLSEGADPETPITMMSHDCEDVKEGTLRAPTAPGTASYASIQTKLPARPVYLPQTRHWMSRPTFLLPSLLPPGGHHCAAHQAGEEVCTGCSGSQDAFGVATVPG